MHVALFERQPYGTEVAQLWYDSSHKWKRRNREKNTKTKHKPHLKGFSQVSFPIQTLQSSPAFKEYSPVLICCEYRFSALVLNC